MATLYVARSTKLSKWASDVGLGKHIYKVGITDEPIKELVAAGWAGETDWALVKKDTEDALTEEVVLERLAKRETMIDSKYYPRIRDTPGIFKINPTHVESSLIVGRALDGGGERETLKLKPTDIATYLIHNARR